jgi:hypothetical protein
LQEDPYHHRCSRLKPHSREVRVNNERSQVVLHQNCLDENFSQEHRARLVELWSTLQHIQPHDNLEDANTWKLTSNGEYTAKLAYTVQFLGSTLSILHKPVCNGLSLKFNFLHGFLCKIECGLRTGCKREGDQIAVYAHFANKLQSDTFLSITATPFAFENL